MKIKDIRADVILISHGHEDHLNTNTLKELNNSYSIILIPTKSYD